MPDQQPLYDAAQRVLGMADLLVLDRTGQRALADLLVYLADTGTHHEAPQQMARHLLGATKEPAPDVDAYRRALHNVTVHMEPGLAATTKYALARFEAAVRADALRGFQQQDARDILARHRNTVIEDVAAKVDSLIEPNSGWEPGDDMIGFIAGEIRDMKVPE